jgi:hypothetical protein
MKPRTAALQKNGLRLEYDHHSKSTSGSRFHADHANLCIGVVQITNGQSSKILCSSLVGDRNLVNERIRKGSMDRRALLRNVTKRVTLWRNVLDMYLRNMNRNLPEHWVVLEAVAVRLRLEPGYLGRIRHREIHMQGSRSSIKRRLGSRWTGVTDTY